MNLWKNQKGVSLWGLVGIFLLAGFLLLYGSQVGLTYLDKNTVGSAVKSVLMENKTNDNATPSSIKSAILKKISMSDSILSSDGLTVYTRSGGFVVDVKMEKQIEVTSDISILVHFEFTEESQ